MVKVIPLVAAAGASGVALALYARVEWPWSLLGWILFVPWLAALDRIESLRGTIAAAAMMAVAFVVAVFAWLPVMIADYTAASLATASVVFLLTAPLLEPQLLVYAVARHLARRLAAPWWAVAAIGAGVYVGAEWTLPKAMGDTIGHGQLPAVWIRQSADLFGAHGITFALLFVNEAILELARRLLVRRQPGARPLRPALAAAAVLCAMSAYGALRAGSESAGAGAPIGIAAIQANVSHYDRLRDEMGTFEAVGRILEAHFALSAQAVGAGDVDVLLWPETVYPTTFGTPKSADGAGFDRAIAAFVQRQGVPLVFGAYDAEGAIEYNAAVFLEPGSGEGVQFDVYRKTRLFPFTEYLPWPLDTARLRRHLPWAGTWQPGAGARAMTLALRDGRTVRVAPLICYDAIDPAIAAAAVREGAEVLLTLSNDSWFDYPGARELILTVSAFRSIETRRTQVRATPTGLSAIIDAAGGMVAVADANQPAILFGSVRPTSSRTVFVELGRFFAPAGGIAAALVLLVLLASRRRAMRHGSR